MKQLLPIVFVLSATPAALAELSSECQKSIEQSRVMSEEIDNRERDVLQPLKEDLQSKGSRLYAKKKGCIAEYFELDIRGNVASLKYGQEILQSLENDPFFVHLKSLLSSSTVEAEAYYWLHATKVTSVSNWEAMRYGEWWQLGIPRTMSGFLKYQQQEIDRTKADIARVEKELADAKQIQEQAVAASLESFQGPRDDAKAKYAAEKANIDALYQKQLDFINSDKTCSQAEREDMYNDTDKYANSTAYFNGFWDFQPAKIVARIEDLEQPVSIDEAVKRLNEFGCKN